MAYRGPRKLSGPTSSKPAPNTMFGGLYFDTEEEAILVSDGIVWREEPSRNRLDFDDLYFADEFDALPDPDLVLSFGNFAYWDLDARVLREPFPGVGDLPGTWAECQFFDPIALPGAPKTITRTVHSEKRSISFQAGTLVHLHVSNEGEDTVYVHLFNEATNIVADGDSPDAPATKLAEGDSAVIYGGFFDKQCSIAFSESQYEWVEGGSTSVRVYAEFAPLVLHQGEF